VADLRAGREQHDTAELTSVAIERFGSSRIAPRRGRAPRPTARPS
jgi:hypothetical protein